MPARVIALLSSSVQPSASFACSACHLYSHPVFLNGSANKFFECVRDAIVSAVSRQGTDSDKFELRIPSNGNKMTRCFNVLAVYDKVDDATKIGTSGAQHTTVNHVTYIILKSIDACFAVCRMIIAILTTKDA